jgi:hypothetical protein
MAASRSPRSRVAALHRSTKRLAGHVMHEPPCAFEKCPLHIAEHPRMHASNALEPDTEPKRLVGRLTAFPPACPGPTRTGPGPHRTHPRERPLPLAVCGHGLSAAHPCAACYAIAALLPARRMCCRLGLVCLLCPAGTLPCALRFRHGRMQQKHMALLPGGRDRNGLAPRSVAGTLALHAAVNSSRGENAHKTPTCASRFISRAPDSPIVHLLGRLGSISTCHVAASFFLGGVRVDCIDDRRYTIPLSGRCHSSDGFLCGF